jgi:hypothetical protein
MSPEKTYNLTLGQVGAISLKVYELKTLVSLLVAAASGQETYDEQGFALMLEDKFQEFYDLYHEALGDELRYQRYPTR